MDVILLSFRAHSSVGLEHLPYKQGVGGSNPSAPTLVAFCEEFQAYIQIKMSKYLEIGYFRHLFVYTNIDNSQMFHKKAS